MSVKHLALAADIIGLTATRKLVLFALASECDGNGRVLIDNSRIREITGLSERAARSAWQWLENNGYLITNDKPWRWVLATWNWGVSL